MKKDTRYKAEMVGLRHVMEILVCNAKWLAARSHDMIRFVFWKDNWKSYWMRARRGEKSEVITVVLVTNDEVIFRSSLEPDSQYTLNKCFCLIEFVSLASCSNIANNWP